MNRLFELLGIKDNSIKKIKISEDEIIFLNSKDEEIEWITVKGNHIPIKKGQGKDEAIATFFEKKKAEKEDDPNFDLPSVSTTRSGIDIIEKKGKFGKVISTKLENLDPKKYPEINIRITKQKVRGKDEFVKNEKVLKILQDKGYEIVKEYKSWETNLDNRYLLKKKENIKKQETEQEFKDRILKNTNIKYEPLIQIIDWGTSMRGQGKRVGKTIIGAMSAMPRGKKEYKDLLGNLPEIKERQYLRSLSEGEKLAYYKARNAGYSPDDSELFAFSLFEEENLLYKKLKETNML